MQNQVKTEEPKIPFNTRAAFYKLRIDPSDNKIKPSYQWKECSKKIIFCVKWEMKTVYFTDLEWFYLNGFGLKIRETIE